jgi:hypothetical protein
MLVGSAPCFSYGTIDPIAGLGRLAQEHGVWLHVDACVGGYVAPFAAKAGYPIPTFDFAVPGVTSISADLHKFGFCPKPASTVFYRSADRAACQPFEMDDWPGGKFATATLVGTRPGIAVAGAWATLQMGEQGYVSTARQIMGLAGEYRRGIRRSALRSSATRTCPSCASRRTNSTCSRERSDGYARMAAGPGARAARHALDVVDVACAGARITCAFARRGRAGAPGKWQDCEGGCYVLRDKASADYTTSPVLRANARKVVKRRKWNAPFVQWPQVANEVANEVADRNRLMGGTK